MRTLFALCGFSDSNRGDLVRDLVVVSRRIANRFLQVNQLAVRRANSEVGVHPLPGDSAAFRGGQWGFFVEELFVHLSELVQVKRPCPGSLGGCNAREFQRQCVHCAPGIGV